MPLVSIPPENIRKPEDVFGKYRKRTKEWNGLKTKYKIPLDLVFKWKSVYVLCLRGTYRSSHRRCSVRKGILRNFAKLIRKHMYQRLFLNKVTGLNFIKKETLVQVFSSEFCEISKTLFYRTLPDDCFWT